MHQHMLKNVQNKLLQLCKNTADIIMYMHFKYIYNIYIPVHVPVKPLGTIRTIGMTRDDKEI